MSTSVRVEERSTTDESRHCVVGVEVGDSRFVTTQTTVYVEVVARRSDSQPWPLPTLHLPVAGMPIGREAWQRLREAADICFAAYAERWPS